MGRFSFVSHLLTSFCFSWRSFKLLFDGQEAIWIFHRTDSTHHWISAIPTSETKNHKPRRTSASSHLQEDRLSTLLSPSIRGSQPAYVRSHFEMCLFVYTLSACSHTHFQNVAECPTARGLADTTQARRDMTLAAPKFLFDTARSTSHTPEFYTAAFGCKKRRATRPVPTVCEGCLRSGEEALKEREAGPLRAPRAVVGGVVAGCRGSDSDVALVAGSASGSDVCTSGMD